MSTARSSNCGDSAMRIPLFTRWHMASKKHTRQLTSSPSPTYPKARPVATSTRHFLAWRGNQWRRSTASLLHLFRVNGSSSEGRPKRRINEPMPVESQCDMDKPRAAQQTPILPVFSATMYGARALPRRSDERPNNSTCNKKRQRRVTKFRALLSTAQRPKGTTDLCETIHTGKRPTSAAVVPTTQRSARSPAEPQSIAWIVVFLLTKPPIVLYACSQPAGENAP